MSLSFDSIPNDLIEGGLYTEIRSTGAGVSDLVRRALLLCPVLTGGLLTTTAPRRVFSSADPDKLCGVGSIGSAMLRAFIAAAPSVELYALGLAAGESAATCAVTLEGSATVDGTMALYIAGTRIAVDVAKNATAVEVGTALAAAINGNQRLPATAASVAGEGGTSPSATLTITSKDKHSLANSIDVRFNYYESDARSAPKGINTTVPGAGMTGGTGAITAANVVTAIAGIPYDAIVWPDASEANVKAIAAELATRWGPMIDQPGHAFVALAGDVSEATTLSTALNSPHVTVVGTSDSPTMPCIWASVLAAVDAAEPDPARPRRTLPLPGIMAPSKIWDHGDRRSALLGGTSTWTVDAGGNVLIDRLVTTYLRNADGISDSSYREGTTLRTLAEMRDRWHARIRGKYPRHKLGDDETDFPPGQPVVQPKTIRAEAIAFYDEQIEDGLAQDPKTFAANLIVEHNAQDANRLDVRMRVKILGKFLTLATGLEFEQ